MAKTQPAMVGLFVIGAAIIAIGGLLTFGGARWLTPSTKAVLYFEESVGGLYAGSGVNFRGVRIGEVDRVTLEIDPVTSQAIMPVYISITPGDIFGELPLDSVEDTLEQWIDQGLSGQLQNTNLLTGQLAISIDFRPRSDAKIQDRPGQNVPQIPVVASQVEQFREAFTEVDWQDIVSQFEATMTSVTGLTDMLQEELAGSGDSLDRAASAAEELVGEARLTLQELTTSTQQTLQALAEFSQSAESTVARLEDRASTTLTNVDRLVSSTETTVTTSGEDLTRVLVSTENTLATIETVSQQISALTHPRSAERDDLQRTLRDLATASATLSRFATLIENNPNALFFGATEAEE